jgi:hypothetical protein
LNALRLATFSLRGARCHQEFTAGCHVLSDDALETAGHPMANQQLWRTEDGLRLRALREAQGWDVWALARRCSLSACQVRQLEEGGESQFYSPSIKALAGRRALACLEAHPTRPSRPATPPSSTPARACAPAPAPDPDPDPDSKP